MLMNRNGDANECDSINSVLSELTFINIRNIWNILEHIIIIMEFYRLIIISVLCVYIFNLFRSRLIFYFAQTLYPNYIRLSLFVVLNI
jgi:hypothetical protein